MPLTDVDFDVFFTCVTFSDRGFIEFIIMYVVSIVINILLIVGIEKVGEVTVTVLRKLFYYSTHNNFGHCTMYRRT